MSAAGFRSRSCIIISNKLRNATSHSKIFPEVVPAAQIVPLKPQQIDLMRSAVKDLTTASSFPRLGKNVKANSVHAVEMHTGLRRLGAE